MPPKLTLGAYNFMPQKLTLGAYSFLIVRVCVRPSMSRAYSILFVVKIQNSVCAYTLGSPSVAYFFQLTVTLTSGLSSRKIMSGVYLLYHLT